MGRPNSPPPELLTDHTTHWHRAWELHFRAITWHEVAKSAEPLGTRPDPAGTFEIAMRAALAPVPRWARRELRIERKAAVSSMQRFAIPFWTHRNESEVNHVQSLAYI